MASLPLARTSQPSCLRLPRPSHPCMPHAFIAARPLKWEHCPIFASSNFELQASCTAPSPTALFAPTRPLSPHTLQRCEPAPTNLKRHDPSHPPYWRDVKCAAPLLSDPSTAQHCQPTPCPRRRDGLHSRMMVSTMPSLPPVVCNNRLPPNSARHISHCATTRWLRACAARYTHSHNHQPRHSRRLIISHTTGTRLIHDSGAHAMRTVQVTSIELTVMKFC
jgi:hypothetical protein